MGDNVGAMVVLTEKRQEQGPALLQWMFRNYQLWLHQYGITIVYIRPPMLSVKSSIGEVPLAMANEEMVKLAVDEEWRQLKRRLKKLENLCLGNKVRVKVISLVSSPGSTGKLIVKHVSQLRPRAVFMTGPSQKGLKWKLSRHFSTAGYVQKNVPRWCTVHIVSEFDDHGDSSSCSPRISRSSSQSSLFSINHADKELQEADEIYSLEDWLIGKAEEKLQWQDITQITLKIAATATSDVSPRNILLRGKHLHKVLAFEGHESFKSVQPLEKSRYASTNVSSFGLLLLQILARQPSPNNLVEKFQFAVKRGKLEALLDPSAGWPLKPAREIAVLALECRSSTASEDSDSSFDELQEVLGRLVKGGKDDEETVTKLDLDFFERTTRFSRSEDGLYVDLDLSKH